MLRNVPMKPLSECPKATLAAIRGVLTDIDETVSTEGRLTPEAYAALAALKQEFGRLRPALALLVESGP